ncbi:ABC transporter substrate-binding protein [Leucobacter sp. UT-8R-CII-1-4]|uniref:ABC transporter substrate-binding protein n=1 Tax=Leucobacter sp. UT-8R-CII-1-4 TaxID=3040075 RepID=UPI0024A98D9F|nr:ABC transporter substrate-binding protein [Leucobacter sp. UT-8R-CII-1-4]MDI6022664.1 ABC transporter substrate-binding protein [Leucobacter sp. UT-8R-CII-1-4]
MRTLSKSKGATPIAVGAGITMMLSLVACTPSVPGGSGGGDSSTMTILLSDSVDNIDPALAFSTGGRQATWMVYESLVRVDPQTGKAIPGLAEEFDFTPTSASFVIKEGAFCADGGEITAGTVARNFERMKDPETNAPLVNNFFGSADFTVEFDDAARTVDVALTQSMPFLGTVPSFTQLGIACDSALENPEVMKNGSDGTAPYVVADFVTGSHITLTRNDDYNWGPEGFKIEELPETVKLQIVADPDTQVNLLLGGEADAASLRVAQLARFEQETGFTQQLADTEISMLMFNEREGFSTADVAVRQALTQAIDPAELTDIETQGLGYVPNFLRPPVNVCVDEDAIADARPTGGVEAGQKTLEAAGYTKNADGIYEKNGTPISVQFLQMELTSPSVEFITDAWTKLGVQVEVDGRAPGQAVDVLTSGTGWGSSIVGIGSSQPTGIRPFFVGPAAPEGPNFGAVSNPVYAQKQGEASQLTGLESCGAWIEAESAIVSNADWVPTIASDTQWVLRDGVSFFNDSAQIDPLNLRKK